MDYNDNNYNNGYDPNQQNNDYSDPYQSVPAYSEEPQGSKGLSITSMVLGICSIVFSCCCLGGGLGIAALVTGIIAKVKNKPGSGMALAGIITGAVGLLIYIVLTIIGLASGSSDSFYESFMEGYNSGYDAGSNLFN